MRLTIQKRIASMHFWLLWILEKVATMETAIRNLIQYKGLAHET